MAEISGATGIMGIPIPERDVKFARMAAQLGLVTSDRVREALELYRRYQAAGGEVPSIPRIMVAKGYIPRDTAVELLRQIAQGSGTMASVPAASIGTAGEAVLKARPASAHPAQPTISPPAPAPVLGGGLIPLAGTPGTDVPAVGPAQSLPSNRLADRADAPSQWPAGVQKGRLLAKAVPAAPAAPEATEQGGASAGISDDDKLAGYGATVLRYDIKGYKILEVVGEGSMGIVYRAHQISMDRIVALKVLPPSKTKDHKFVQQFLTEARNIGKLNHPNLVRVHEVGRSGDVFYYSMEYIDGLTLGEVMDECEGGRLEPRRAVNIMMQIAAALDHGHKMGMVHREIRPESIMILEGDVAKLSELGLTKDESARFLEGENPQYVAPEQLKGAEADTRTDIYSLGCVFFHALTGEPPFGIGGPKEILGRRLLAEVPDPKAVNENLPDDLVAVIRRMMAKDPGDRYQSPAELLEDLKRLTLAPPAAQRPTTKGLGRVARRYRGGLRRRRR